MIIPAQPYGDLNDLPYADASNIRSFRELRKEGYTPFILGPVYVYAEVRWDLIQQFYELVCSEPVRSANYDVAKGRLEVSTEKLDVRGAQIIFERAIITNCPGWSNAMTILDSKSFTHFKKWILAQQFVNRATNRFYIVRHYLAPMLDPLALDTKGEAVPESVDLFSICGMRGSLVPVSMLDSYTRAKAYLEMQQVPPDEAVVVLGSAALKIVKES